MSRRRTILLLLLALVLFVAGASVLFPSYAEICHQSNDATHKDCTKYHITLVALRYVVEMLNYYGVAVAAVATAFVGYFTYTIWTVNKNQLRHAREVERAYVSGSATTVEDQLWPDECE